MANSLCIYSCKKYCIVFSQDDMLGSTKYYGNFTQENTGCKFVLKKWIKGLG